MEIASVIKLVVDPSYGLFVCNEFGDYYPQPLSLSIDNGTSIGVMVRCLHHINVTNK